MTERGKAIEKGKDGGGRSSETEIAAFLSQVAALPPTQKAAGRGRLIFAMDATASRGPTWDFARQVQGEMFSVAGTLGGLDVQLMYFRGFGECKASRWVADSQQLADAMAGVTCSSGHTQIGKVLGHALRESARHRINALVYIGDCMEENADDLAAAAGQLGLHNIPVFLFQEGDESVARTAFQTIARLSKGAWCRFDAGSADTLRALLGAVAAYSAGGRKALASYANGQGEPVRLLARQIG